MNAIEILKSGNEKQQRAYQALMKSKIFDQFSKYPSLLCGTIPLDIDHGRSDLDIVLSASDLDQLAIELKEIFGECTGFVQRKIERKGTVLLTNFYFEDFEFELFASNQPSELQNGYLHMLIEYHILQEHPEWKERIKIMKREGIKTEPAFCKLLKLEGNPYNELIQYGKRKSYI